MSRFTITALGTALDTATKIGATLPKSFTDRQQELDALNQKVRHYLLEQEGDNLASAFLDSLAADRDPATDREVQAAAARHALAGIRGGIEHALNQRTQQLVDEQAPAILAAYAKPFSKAAESIEAGIERLGNVDLNDTAAILGRGGDAARVWADAREATESIKQITQVWKLLSNVTGSVGYNSLYRLLVICDVPAETFITDQLGNSDMGAWDAARRGYPLSLATPDTYRERMAEVADAHAESTRKSSAAVTEAWRRQHRMKVSS